MDVVRSRRRATPARVLVPTALVALIGAAGYAALGLLRPQAAEPVIERNTILTDTAVRGDFVRSVHAAGTFVAERIRIAAAPADGMIDAIPVRVGSNVDADTTVAQLSDPDLRAAVIDARAQIVAARATERSVEAEARAAELDKAATLAAALSNYQQLDEDAKRYRGLHASGLVSDYDYRVAQIKAQGARDAIGFARRGIAVDAADAAAKMAVEQAKIAQLTAALDAKDDQAAALNVRAGASGVVQSIAVERGARVTAGTQLARIVGQRDLKVTLAVPESDIRDVSPGLATSIQTANGTVRGHVSRIDPAAQNGVIAVDVTLDGTLPADARPDLHVDGTIELERLRDVVSIARPANAADATTVDVYRLVDGGTRALRTRIRLGRGSIDRVPVVAGLAPGTTIITSDTSAYTAAALRVQ
jgi:HlyD family secretion protein